jgi:hypothetical protein
MGQAEQRHHEGAVHPRDGQEETVTANVLGEQYQQGRDYFITIKPAFPVGVVQK